MASQTLTDVLFPPAAAIAASPLTAAAAPSLPVSSLSKSILATSIYDRQNSTQHHHQHQQQQQNLPASMMMQTRVTAANHQTSFISPHHRYLPMSDSGPSSQHSLPGTISGGIGLVLPSHPMTPVSHLPARRPPPSKTGFGDEVQVASFGGGGGPNSLPMGGRYIWPAKIKADEPNIAASVAAAAVVAAAAYSHRSGMTLGTLSSAASASPYISGQPVVKMTSMTGSKDTINCLAVNAKSYQELGFEGAAALMTSYGGSIGNHLRATNGWSSSSSGLIVANQPEQHLANDQPLDLSSMKRKRLQEITGSEDSPLDLSTKRRRLEEGGGYGVGVKQQLPDLTQCVGYFGGRGMMVPTRSTGSRLSVHRPPNPVEVHRFFDPNPVLIPPNPGAVRFEPKNRQPLNSRQRGGGATASRMSYPGSSSFQLFPNKTAFSESPHIQPIEVPVIKIATSFQSALPSSSGGATYSTLSTVVEPGASAGTDAAAGAAAKSTDAILNPYSLSFFQQQQQQQQAQRQLLLLNGCTNQSDNIPKLPDSKVSILKDYDKEMTKFSTVTSRSNTVLELGPQYRDIHSTVTFSLHQQQQHGSITHSFTPSTASSLLQLPVVRASIHNNQTRLNLPRNVTSQPLASDNADLCCSSRMDSFQVIESDLNRGSYLASTSKVNATWSKRQTKRVKSRLDDDESKVPMAPKDSQSKSSLHPGTDAELVLSNSDSCQLVEGQSTYDLDRNSLTERPSKPEALSENRQSETETNSKSLNCGKTTWALEPVEESKWPRNLLNNLCSDSNNSILQSGGKLDIVESIGPRGDLTTQGDLKGFELPTASFAPKIAPVGETLVKQEADFASTKTSDEPGPHESSNCSQQATTGCEDGRRRNSLQERETVLLSGSSCSKVLASCRDEVCGHQQGAITFVGSGEVMPRICRVFDRPVPRHIPVANVQPFMKETPEVAAAKTPVDQTSITNTQPNAAKTETTSPDLVETESTIKLPPTTVSVKELPPFNRNLGDTPHHMEFVRFLGMKVDADDKESSNPFRTPVEKLHDQLKSCDVNRGSDCDDKGRIRRQLLLHLAGPKSRQKNSGGSDGKRDGSIVGFESVKKTPIEYIDDDADTAQDKRNNLAPETSLLDSESQTKDQTRDSSSEASFTDPSYKSTVLYQTMKALDRQTDGRATDPLHTIHGSDFGTDRSSEEGTNDGVEGASESSLDLAKLEKRKTNKKRKKKDQSISGGASGGGIEGRLNAAAADDDGSTSLKELPTDGTGSSGGSSESLPVLPPRPTTKRKYQRKRPLEAAANSECRGSKQGNQSIGFPVGNSSCVTANSSPVSLFGFSSSPSPSCSSTPDPSPAKKRRGPGKTGPQYVTVDSSGQVGDWTDATGQLTVDDRAQQQLTCLPSDPAAAAVCRRRGRGMTVRREGIHRNTRRGGGVGCGLDRTFHNEVSDPQPVDGQRSLIRRGQRRGSRIHGGTGSGQRYQPLTSHNHLEESHPTESISKGFYGATEVLQPGQEARKEPPVCDLFDYDETNESFDLNRRGQGRKPVRKNGRISFQYPEVFGRRRARGGLRGRSRAVRGSVMGGRMPGGIWSQDDAETRSTFDEETIGTEEMTIYRCKNRNSPVVDPCGGAPSAAQLPPSVRGNCRSRVRVNGRGSRGHPGAPSRFSGFVTSTGPSASTALGRGDASETRLHQVTRLGYEELVSYYLTSGIIHPNVQDNLGVTPLHDSCSRGHFNITRMLLDHGAHPNSKTLDGTRPLHLAVANDHIEIVRLLLSFGANVSMTDSAGKSPVQLAKARDMKQLLKGFVSDLSSGKGKEIPWQFPASYETNQCDLLSDLPSDEEMDSTEVVFDLEVDRSLLVHRLSSDPHKGLRNFHNVSDLCRDVKVEDFLLLNGDFNFVHVSTTSPPHSDAPAPSTSTSSASFETSRIPDRWSSVGSSSASMMIFRSGPSSTGSFSCQRILGSETADKSCFVEIDSNLKELLEISVQKIPVFIRGQRSTLSQSVTTKKTGRKVNFAASTSANSTSGASTIRYTSTTTITTTTTSATLSSSFSSSCSPFSTKQGNPGPENSDLNSGSGGICSLSAPVASGDLSLRENLLKNLSHQSGAVASSSSSSSSSSSLPAPPSLPLSDSVAETRVALESCRIVLRDISIQPGAADLNTSKSGPWKETNSSSCDMEEKKAERQRSPQKDIRGSSEKPLPVSGSSEKTSKETMPGPVVVVANSCAHVERRCAPNRLGSTERNATAGCSASTTQPETLIPIPVLEKHDSEDEVVPVEKDEDKCGEPFDDEREMPQLTLYA